MEWVTLVLGILVAGSVGMAWDDKRKAKKAGEPTGSLWGHYKQALDKSNKESQAKKAAKLKRKTEESHRKATAVGVSAETSVAERESTPEAARPKGSLYKAQTENRQSVHEAMSSKTWKKKARKAREKAEPAPMPKAGLGQGPEPAKQTPSSACPIYVGEWRDTESVSVDFEYLSEGGEPLSISLVACAVCDSHFSGISLDPEDGTDDQVFDFERVVGRVYFPIDDESTDADGLRRRLLASVTSKSASQPDYSSVGDRLRFVYQDSRGNVTTREITNWDDTGTYLEGFCHKAGDVRTFRRDRIVEVLQGEHLLVPIAPNLDTGGKSGGAMEILFTGFAAGERASLEEDAEAYGLVVRKTVTKNLDFVCAGPRAGSTKLAKARDQGCTVLDEDDFWSLVEDGMMPEK